MSEGGGEAGGQEEVYGMERREMGRRSRSRQERIKYDRDHTLLNSLRPSPPLANDTTQLARDIRHSYPPPSPSALSRPSSLEHRLARLLDVNDAMFCCEV